ncbi:uncharacterized protein LOC131951977 [Physella acuta]|uniref:uncharacterized protein LOC131951977 n=1 Tax=Physella acuta TaxID=109671 RepID=UPI0027DC9DD5|nr:uncharacterized protein LOC131951977 [Physella acuta]
MPGFSCPSGKHGPSCQKNCSQSCSGDPRDCHVISAVCKQCPDLNHTGVNCETELSPVELELRSTACEDFTGGFGQVRVSNRRHDRRTARDAKLPDGNDNQRHGTTNYMFIVAVVVVVVAFLFACSIYVMIIRHCIREKRKKLVEIEKERIRRISMMSYTELQGEYDERAANWDVHSLGANRDKSHSGPSERSRHSSVKSEKVKQATTFHF